MGAVDAPIGANLHIGRGRQPAYPLEHRFLAGNCTETEITIDRRQMNARRNPVRSEKSFRLAAKEKPSTEDAVEKRLLAHWIAREKEGSRTPFPNRKYEHSTQVVQKALGLTSVLVVQRKNHLGIA